MGGLARSPIGRFGRRARDAGRGALRLYGGSGNARIETLLAYLALSAALAEGSAWRSGLVVVASASVLALEAMNSAVEYTVDRIGREHHPLAGAAKDSAAGAVLIAAVGAAALALLCLVPRVAACWQAFRSAPLWAQALWLGALVLLGAGAFWPERLGGQGGGRSRRIG